MSTHERNRLRVGFAGLGLMGSRMAAQLLAKGFPVTVWNRSAEKTRPLAAAGAAVAATPRELAQGSDVVVTMLSDPPALEAVYGGPDGLFSGCVRGVRFVDMSTIGPAAARSLAARAEGCGCDFVEAPVTGSKAGAEAGTLVIMASGRDEALEAVMPVLLAMGSKVIRAGGTGAASQLKLLGNLMIGMMLEGLSEALVLGTKTGLDPETILELFRSSGYASPYYDFKGKAILARDFTQHFSIDLMHKDLALLLANATDAKVALPGAAVVREVYQAARAMGLGDEDICATVKVAETLGCAEAKGRGTN